MVVPERWIIFRRHVQLFHSLDSFFVPELADFTLPLIPLPT